MNIGKQIQLRKFGRLIVATIGALLISACSSGGQDGTATDTASALVKTVQAQAGSVPLKLRIYGAADAGTSSRRDLVALSESIVQRVHVQPGARVRRGTPIVSLRPSPASQLDIAKARSDASLATSAHARMQRLRVDGLASSGDVEAAAAASRSANATVASLNARSASTVLIAAADGVVSAVNVSPGDVVAPGVTVASITPATARRARFGIDPEEARMVQAGMSVRVIPTSAPAFPGSVVSVDFSVDPATRLASLYVPLPATSMIGAGEPLVAEIDIPGGAAKAVSPYSALLDDGGQPYVYVVRQGTAQRRNVSIGTQSGGMVAIISGLDPGETVVTEGGTALEDGVKVRLK